MIAVGIVALYAVSYIWARKSLKMSISDASALALTVGFPNSAAVALPLLTTASGPSSRVTAALSISVGAITISALTVALLESDRPSDRKSNSIQAVVIKVLQAFTRPVVWAPVFALGITELFHMSHTEIRDITLISAIPAGFFGLRFGKSFNATPETAGSALIASYCVGAFSLAVWMLVLTKYF